MRQDKNSEPQDVEYGFCVCKDAKGKLVRGPESTGGPYNVSVDVSCPPGAKPVSLFHTHPHGVPEPSQADISEARRYGIESLCIKVPQTGVTKCHNVPRKGMLKQ